MSGLRIRITALSNSEGEKILKNTTERRQSIFNILYKRRKETIDNLTFEFNFNERTIRRNLEILSVSFPIYTTAILFIDKMTKIIIITDHDCKECKNSLQSFFA